MFAQISRLDSADKKTRNQQPCEGAIILALMEGVLWGLVLLLFAVWHVVER